MASGSRALDIDQYIQADGLAAQIAATYQEWEMYRSQAADRWKEIQEYVFATDTHSTSNSDLGWKNSTHLPKLCQIRDNLHANYIAALFPNMNPIEWEGDSDEAETKQKRQVIETYLTNKMRMGGFQSEVSRIILDWIDYGNCYGMVEFVANYTTDSETGEKTPGFVGPRIVRISPWDIVFNPTATSFEESPKIIRELKTLGSLRADIEDRPEGGYLEGAFDMVKDVRKKMNGIAVADVQKNDRYLVDGFASYMDYFQSNYIELLHFYGDWYDVSTDTLYKNRIITIGDRCKILRNIPNPSWLGSNGIRHCGWRLRPDNLYAMGPLDNLVGMQYRIDHLENAKADGFDLIIHPVMKIKGFVEDFNYAPGERIFCGDEGDVEFQSPDTTMLNADTQISIYEQKMEEMAGAPKQAMGIRTPGEKTAFEVQILENGANRVFINKTAYFEEVFLEPLVNSMLEVSRRNMGPADIIRVVDDQTGVVEFMNITKEDITARGKIRPVGARRFAQKANMVQNLTQLSASPLMQDPSINVHFSGQKIAALIENLLELERWQIYSPNVRIIEQTETGQMVQASQQRLQEQQAAVGAPNANPMVQPPQNQV
jgi:hypothetical protein